MILRSKLSIVVCSKADLAGLMRTLVSLRKLQNDIPEIILVLSGYRKADLISIDTEFSTLHLTLISTPALGVYEAQNLGLHKSRKQFILFLNGGDEITGPSGITHLIEAVKDNKWGYGSINLINPSNTHSKSYHFRYRKILHRLGLKYVPHPGTIINAQQGIKLGAFDTKYRVSADHKLLLALARISKPIVVKNVISNFYLNGASTRSHKEIVWDCKNISRETFGFFAGSKFIDSLIWNLVLIMRGLIGRRN